MLDPDMYLVNKKIMLIVSASLRLVGLVCGAGAMLSTALGALSCTAAAFVSLDRVLSVKQGLRGFWKAAGCALSFM